MEELGYIIQILEKSVEKHGADKPLTIGHLLNILKMADRQMEQEEGSYPSQDEMYAGWEDF